MNHSNSIHVQASSVVPRGASLALRALGFSALVVSASACQPAPAVAPDDAAASNAAPAASAPDPNATAKQAAIEDVRSWLDLIDHGQYADSWQQAAAVFQSATTPDQWTGAVTSAREPLGEITSREVVASQLRESLPGAPPGNYVVIEYASAFAKKERAKEIVTAAQAPDGSWKVAGYFIE